MPTLTPCLWFDGQAEEAARFYCSIFPNSRITLTVPYGPAGVHSNKPADAVLCVSFELEGQPFSALNGRPPIAFNEAISLQIPCRTQAEIDHYWDRLTAGGGQPISCGWLKDKFGVAWQVFPEKLLAWISDHASPASQRTMTAMMGMTRMDLAALERAYRGQ